MPPRLRWLVWPILFMLFVVGASLDALPDRRQSARLLVWLTLLSAVLLAACLARLRWRSVA